MGRVVYEEVERLSKRNHEVAVFTLRYPNDIRDVEKDAMNRVSTIPFKVVHLKPLFRMGDGGEIPQLFFALQQADLIHLHYPFYGGEEWVLLAAKWFKKPYVVTLISIGIISLYLERLIETGKTIRLFGNLINWERKD
jgi:glycosyltransferase involved in cell wall biosynthesis